MMKRVFCLVPTKRKLLGIHYQGWMSNYVPIHEKQKIYLLKKIKPNMCQFINCNNVYGSKVVDHIIIKSIIIFGSSMP
jgi:hypothetical protein